MTIQFTNQTLAKLNQRHYLFGSPLSVSFTVTLKGTAAAVPVIIGFPLTSRSYPTLVLLPEVLNIKQKLILQQTLDKTIKDSGKQVRIKKEVINKLLKSLLPPTKFLLMEEIHYFFFYEVCFSEHFWRIIDWRWVGVGARK